MEWLDYYLHEFPLFKVGIVGLIAVIATELLSLLFRRKGVFFWLESVFMLAAEILFCLHARCTPRSAFLYGLFLLFTVLFFSPFLFFQRKGGKRRPVAEKKREDRRLPVPVVERVLPNDPAPAPRTAVADVQLDYAAEALARLRTKKLKEADKIEAEVIEKTLSVYRGKQTLTPQESKTLNACLSSVLKMMSAYSF